MIRLTNRCPASGGNSDVVRPIHRRANPISKTTFSRRRPLVQGVPAEAAAVSSAIEDYHHPNVSAKRSVNLKVSNIRLPVGEDESAIPERCARQLSLPVDQILSLRILRKSLDIRDKRKLEFVYTTAVTVADSNSVRRGPFVADYTARPFEPPAPGDRPMTHRPVIAGAGPAGLFAAFQLAELGYAPIVLERGKKVRDRIRDVEAFDEGGPLDPESNYLFGEGGAGTFSDGKLTCRNTGPDAERVLEIIAQCKGKPQIVYEAKPHLGSNRLPAVVKAIRQRIEAYGGEFRFGVRVEDLIIEDGVVRGVTTSAGRVDCEILILAIGHSARDTYRMLLSRGVPIRQKPFQMGVRIEQPQAQVTAAQYGCGPQASLLGPADYTMNVQVGDRELFTFCMCAGGYVMPSVSQHGYFCTNGMSRARHESPFANSGLVVTIDPAELGYGDDPLAGVLHQESIEQAAYEIGRRDYLCPIQRVDDFLAGRPSAGRVSSSYARGVMPTNLADLLPADVTRWLLEGLPIMDRRWKGKFLQDATLVAPETRGSAPVRLDRDRDTRQSPGIQGLYPIGEGAGYAGGIVSAAVDGLRTARVVITEYRPAQ